MVKLENIVEDLEILLPLSTLWRLKISDSARQKCELPPLNREQKTYAITSAVILEACKLIAYSATIYGLYNYLER